MPVSVYSGPSITNSNSLVPAPIQIVKAFKYILNGQLSDGHQSQAAWICIWISESLL